MTACRTLLFLLTAACAACGSGEQPLHSRVAMDHGLAPGARVTATPVECLHGRSRTVADPGATQVVTFATPYDCSACAPHLVGVPKAEREAGVSDHAFLVVWSPRMRSLERDLSANRPDLPICVNRNGSLWDRHNLLHTPFTAVIRNGRVVYMHDGTLLTRRSQTELAADLRKAFAQ